MTKTLHGKVRGRTIEFDEDLGVEEGQEVEVEVKLPPSTTAAESTLSETQAKIYSLLGERYDSGVTDTAERHNENRR